MSARECGSRDGGRTSGSLVCGQRDGLTRHHRAQHPLDIPHHLKTWLRWRGWFWVRNRAGKTEVTKQQLTDRFEVLKEGSPEDHKQWRLFLDLVPNPDAVTDAKAYFADEEAHLHSRSASSVPCFLAVLRRPASWPF